MLAGAEFKPSSHEAVIHCSAFVKTCAQAKLPARNSVALIASWMHGSTCQSRVPKQHRTARSSHGRVRRLLISERRVVRSPRPAEIAMTNSCCGCSTLRRFCAMQALVQLAAQVGQRVAWQSPLSVQSNTLLVEIVRDFNCFALVARTFRDLCGPGSLRALSIILFKLFMPTLRLLAFAAEACSLPLCAGKQLRT